MDGETEMQGTPMLLYHYLYFAMLPGELRVVLLLLCCWDMFGTNVCYVRGRSFASITLGAGCDGAILPPL